MSSKKPLGFQTSAVSKQKSKVELLYDEVDGLVTAVDKERSILHEEEHLLEKVKKDLTRIRKDVDKLRSLAGKRNEIEAHAKSAKNKDDVLSHFAKLESYDRTIVKFSDYLFKEINNHLVGDLSKVYSEENFSKDELRVIGEVANRLSHEARNHSEISRNMLQSNGYARLKEDILSRL